MQGERGNIWEESMAWRGGGTGLHWVDVPGPAERDSTMEQPRKITRKPC